MRDRHAMDLRPRVRARLALALLAGLAAAAGAAPPEAGTTQKAAPRVELKTLAIVATNQDKRVDPALRALAEQLKTTFRFSGYRLAGTDTRVVELGTPATFRLVSPYAVELTPAQIDGDRVELKVQLSRSSDGQASRVMSVRLRLRPGKYQLLGGPAVEDGTLLLGVAARPIEPPRERPEPPRAAPPSRDPRRPPRAIERPAEPPPAEQSEPPKPPQGRPDLRRPDR